MRLKILLDKILDIFFPRSCFGCKKEGSYLCLECERGLRAGKSFKLGEVFIACEYEENGVIGKLIKQFKYKFSEEIAGALGRVIVSKLGNVLKKEKADLLIPVPISRERRKWRGFNQTELLCDAICEELGIEVDKALLLKIKDTPPQARFNRAERLENLKNAFKVNSNRKIPETVCLVDDVYTTGATLNECMKVLKKAGVKRVFGLVIAKKIV